jgi:hypothetical protein
MGSADVSTIIVEMGDSGNDENSRGIVIGGRTDWMFGTKTSFTRDVIKLNPKNKKVGS